MTRSLSPDTWVGLTEHFDTRQIIDLLFTVGAYDTLAIAFNCFGLEVDPELRDSALPTVQPENTVKPENSVQPENTVKPENSVQLENSVQPEN